MLNRCSETLARAEKAYGGVGILMSEYALALADTADDPSAALESFMLYRLLRKAGHDVCFVRAEDLAENRLGVKVLFTGRRTLLSETEQAQISAFCERGGRCFYNRRAGTFGAMPPQAYWDWTEPVRNMTCEEFRGNLEPEDALDLCGMKPLIETGDRHLTAQSLKDGDHIITALVNIDPQRAHIPAHDVRLNFAAKRARFVTPDGETELSVEDGRVRLPEVDAGALLFFE